jgi:hypothetical protein
MSVKGEILESSTKTKTATKTKTEPIAVGGAVQAKCGKCKAETKHTVLAMVEEKAERVRCTICEADHKYRAPAKPRAAAKPRVAKAPGAAKKNAEVEEWAKLSPKWDIAKAVAYKTDASFNKNDLLKHKKFGVGQVQQLIGTNKVRVLFETGVKMMLCSN